MDTGRLEPELDRIALALDRLERAAAARDTQLAELTALKARHRRLKDTVAKELHQLDLLLANLPEPPAVIETPDAATPS
ncbi:hypothetical protein [Novosphingobium sp.]|uniref:hypothetical protein n=1 Tax=Novosphingobium sp. TaxID=1874826 RepID=UPI003340B2BB